MTPTFQFEPFPKSLYKAETVSGKLVVA